MIIGLYVLIPGVIFQILIPTAELAIPTRAPANEGYAKTETQPSEAKTRKCSKELKDLHTWLCFSLIKSLCFISLRR